MSKKSKDNLIETLSETERERVVQLLTRFIIEKRKEKERNDKIKKI